METSKVKSVILKDFARNFGKCAGLIALAAALITVISSLWFHRVVGNYEAAFVGAGLLQTVAFFVAVVLLFEFIYLFAYFFVFRGPRKLSTYAMIFTIIVITYVVCLVFADYINIYALPIGLCATMISVLIERRVGTMSTMVFMLILLLTYFTNSSVSASSMQNAAISVFVNTVGACLLIYMQSKSFTRIKYICFGLLAGFAVLPLTAVVLIALGNDSVTVLQCVAWNFLATVASIICYMFLLPVFESVFNVADDFRLDEICNLKTPLLRKLANEASGTFNHSQSVAILAENCAVVIGENPHLARAGAYYHDIGKLKSPLYFTENQDNYNPHDELIPEVSVSMITAHTTSGAEMIRQYHLPDKVAAICREHHGDMPVRYFYQKAQSISEEELPIENFCYAGPKPQSKISAIIMIADTVEAATRASMPDTREKLEEFVNSLIEEKEKWHQFDECPITFSDLNLIKKTILETLPSIRHTRVVYPDNPKSKKAQ